MNRKSLCRGTKTQVKIYIENIAKMEGFLNQCKISNSRWVVDFSKWMVKKKFYIESTLI